MIVEIVEERSGCREGVIVKEVGRGKSCGYGVRDKRWL